MKTSNGKTDAKTNVLAASIKGSIHKEHEACEDAVAYEVMNDGTLIAAVADGAGSESAPFSTFGSRTATEVVVSFLNANKDSWPTTDQLRAWEKLFNRMYSEILQSICELADRHQVHPNAFATTLIVVVATKKWIASFQIGDGDIVVQEKRDVQKNGSASNLKLTKLSNHESEYINETTFITSDAAIDEATYGYVEGHFSGLAIFTDGLESIAINRKNGAQPRSSFLQPLLKIAKKNTDQEASNRGLQKYLRSPVIQDRTYDDVTILISSFSGDENKKLYVPQYSFKQEDNKFFRFLIKTFHRKPLMLN